MITLRKVKHADRDPARISEHTSNPEYSSVAQNVQGDPTHAKLGRGVDKEKEDIERQRCVLNLAFLNLTIIDTYSNFGILALVLAMETHSVTKRQNSKIVIYIQS